MDEVVVVVIVVVIVADVTEHAVRREISDIHERLNRKSERKS